MATYVESKPSLGGRLGAAFGSGIGQALGNIATHKLKQMEEKRTKDTRKDQFKNLGASDAEADFLASQDPETQYYGARDLIARELKDKPNGEQIIDDWIPASPQEFEKADDLRNVNLQRQREQPQTSAISQALQRPGQPGLKEALQQKQAPQEMQVQQQPSIADRLKQMPSQVLKAPRKDFEGLSLKRGEEKKGTAEGGEKATLQEQKRIDAESKQFRGDLSKAISNAREIRDSTETVIEILETGKAASGIQGSVQSLLGRPSQNKYTQLLDKETKQLAQQLSSQKGLPTKFKIEYAEEQKPSIDQNPEVALTLAKELKKKADFIIELGKVRDGLIAENDYQIPKGLESKLDEYINAQERPTSRLPESFKGEAVSKLPANDSPEAYQEEGKAFMGPNGPIIFISGKKYPAEKQNGIWVRRG